MRSAPWQCHAIMQYSVSVICFSRRESFKHAFLRAQVYKALHVNKKKKHD